MSTAAFDPRIAQTTGDAVFFPVRHHSPAAARLLRQCIARVQPKAILIEGPSDFNPHFAELHRGHQLPIAIYSYIRWETQARSGAFYPFCEYSPEWQAIEAARERAIPAAFIDLPWADLASTRSPSVHCYADGQERRSDYFTALTQRLGLDSYDDFWDQFFEVDSTLTLDHYLDSLHRLLFFARQCTPGDPDDRRREAFMSARIAEALARHGAPLVIVTGGFHSYPLFCRHHRLPYTEPAVVEPEADPEPAPAIAERGIALTPYSYERLDSLTGYDAGMPNPGFYHRSWTTPDVHRALLANVAETLRARKQPISTADLIAAEGLTLALAQLRGHARPWRRDLVDGIRGALIKDDLGPRGWHPVLDAVHAVLRGEQRGQLAGGTALPPLVHDIQRQIAAHDLASTPSRSLTLDLTNPAHLVRARVLHQLDELDIAGYTLATPAGLTRRDQAMSVEEVWSLQRHDAYDATCIEASIYGPSLAEASLAKLEEAAGRLERSASAAAAILLRASLMGHLAVADRLRQQLAFLIREEAGFDSLADALRSLLYLYRYDDVLGAARRDAAAALLREAYTRGLWLVEALGSTATLSPTLPDGIRLLRETLTRCGPALQLAETEFVEVFTRIAAHAVSPTLRGAATGVLFSLNPDTAPAVELAGSANPQDLGDYLTGLFALAKEVLSRSPELIRRIASLVATFDDDAFLIALPPLRLAFTAFTPREKHHIADSLLGRAAAPKLAVPLEVAAAVLTWEGRLYAEMDRYGVKP
ncbi:MAG: hypothetical protein JNK87_30730 [Bryobacterales bacterium]|nr:hypothetical protein [Bryobacterales bacterium]